MQNKESIMHYYCGKLMMNVKKRSDCDSNFFLFPRRYRIFAIKRSNCFIRTNDAKKWKFEEEKATMSLKVWKVCINL